MALFIQENSVKCGGWSFFVCTFGCQMNVHESEKIVAALVAAGGTPSSSRDEADIIIFNTCCIRDSAEQKVLSHIGETKRLGKPVFVVGCLANRIGDEICEKFPHVRVIKGTHIEKYPEVGGGGSDPIYINITFGCENFCAYCIVPYVRGPLKCRDVSEIEEEFKRQIHKGKVIYLLGQNVNSYVCPRTGTTFAALLDRLCAIPGDFVVNFLSSHPKDFSRELVDVIARNLKIERNIHLPMQSGCDKILRLMNRGYSVAEYQQKVDLLRESVPNVHITTDIICGFPGESDTDFEETVETVRRIRFNAAFIFPYSRRSGTAADKMEGHLDAKTKKARATRLIAVQREISNSY